MNHATRSVVKRIVEYHRTPIEIERGTVKTKKGREKNNKWVGWLLAYVERPRRIITRGRKVEEAGDLGWAGPEVGGLKGGRPGRTGEKVVCVVLAGSTVWAERRGGRVKTEEIRS